MAINQFVLMGRLTHEPEVKAVSLSCIPILHFQIAADKKYSKTTNRQVTDKKAEFIQLVAWRQVAEFIGRNFHKGDQIAVEGHIESNSFYGTKNIDSYAHNHIDLVVDEAHLCNLPKYTPPSPDTPIEIIEDEGNSEYTQEAFDGK
jgi:single-strand DNA-binding protein